MPAPFDIFFQATTAGQTPSDYQCRLACGPDANLRTASPPSSFQEA